MGPRPRMPFPQGRPLMEDPAREKAIRSVFGKEKYCLQLAMIDIISMEYLSSSYYVYCIGCRCCHVVCVNVLLCIVFSVANISFETTEEQLRAVLSEVGPVVSLK